MLIGYVRRIPGEATDTAQAIAIANRGAGKLFRDLPGRREARLEMLGGIREGDCILVGDVRAIADGIEDFRNVMDLLEERGASFATAAGDLTVDPRGKEGRTMMRMLRAMAGMDADG